jgi:hypothetical protein
MKKLNQLTTFSNTETLQHIYNYTKPVPYQMILSITKDRMAYEDTSKNADVTYVLTDTLDCVQEAFCQKYTRHIGPVILIHLERMKNSCYVINLQLTRRTILTIPVANKDKHLWTATCVLKLHVGNLATNHMTKALAVTTKSSVTFSFCQKPYQTNQSMLSY